MRTLDVSSTLDHLIFEVDEWWELPEQRQVDLRIGVLADAVAHHIARCPPYARFTERRGFDPALLDTRESLRLVPQIPTTVFKRADVRSVPEDQVVRTFSSSGTTGVRSMVPRDELTLERLAGSLRADLGIWSDVVDKHVLDEDGEVVNLGPSRAEAGGVWFSYVMSLVEVFASTTHCMTGGRLDYELAADRVRRCAADGRFVCLVGPPALVARFCQHVRDRRFACGRSALVVTGGGWKATAAGAVLDRPDFVRLVTDTLGLSAGGQVRDVFNQVELNTVCIECGNGRMHVPPWVEVIVRHPDTLAPVDPGNSGVISFLDASARSYPCFIVGEDLGWTWPDPCGCGRTGQTIAIRRRIDSSAHQGCSVTLLESLRVGEGRP